MGDPVSYAADDPAFGVLLCRIVELEDVLYAVVAAAACYNAELPEPFRAAMCEILAIKSAPAFEAALEEILRTGAASETQRRTRTLLARSRGDATITGPLPEPGEPEVRGTA